MKSARALILSLALLLVASPALAHSRPDNGAPMPMPGSETKPAPVDPSYEPRFSHHATGEWHGGSSRTAGISPQALLPITHTHEFLGVFNQYDGYDPDEKLAGPMSCPAAGAISCTISYSRQRGWSNKFGVSIAFDIMKVRAGVGYDVTHHSSHTVTYSAQFAPGHTAELWSNEWYHVQEFNVMNTFCGTTFCRKEYGSGWAAQWYETSVEPRIWRT